jgi:acyl carrier protein
MPDDALVTLIADVLLIDSNQINDESGIGVTENWDSLRNMMVMAEVERVFAIKIPFKAYTSVATVKDIRALIAKAVG